MAFRNGEESHEALAGAVHVADLMRLVHDFLTKDS